MVKIIYYISGIVGLAALLMFPVSVLILIWHENTSLGLRLVGSSVFLFVFCPWICDMAKPYIQEEESK